MSSDLQAPALTAEELLQRQKQVRKWVLLRGILLGVLVAAWWMLFVPDSVVASSLKYGLGVVVGLVATGGYLYQLRGVFQAPVRD